MTSKDKTSHNVKFISLIALFLVIALFFTFFLFNCFHLYSAYDVDYSDLIYESLTFDRYNILDLGRNGYVYTLYFQEYEDPFCINRITNEKLDKEMLDALAEGSLTHVYYCEDSSRFANYEICEISCSNGMLLSLSDYVRANQNNQIMGMILCPILILASLFLVWFFFISMKPIPDNPPLGKIKIEYLLDGNRIRIHNSLYVCSLVINDTIVDRHYGVSGSHFCLRGRIGSGKNTVRVEARMGSAFMYLYCNGELVVKKFMAFG